MSAAQQLQSARHSRYLTDAVYAELVADFADWQDDARTIDDPSERDTFRRLFEREARLLDRGRFEEWLDLYTDECLYWVPATPEGGDPRSEIAMMFDDRRRLEDRIFRLRTGFAWSQSPASRTARIVANVEVFRARREDRRMVRSSFLISEFWDSEIRSFAGYTGYRCERVGAAWKISAKQVNLINCDQCIRNPSIIF